MKRWSKEHYCSVQTDSTRNVQAELADETPHILYTSSKKYSLYFFIIATFYSHIYTLVHSVQPWFISAELCSWRKNRNLHGFHFSLSSRMFDVFWRFAEKKQTVSRSTPESADFVYMDSYFYPGIWMYYSTPMLLMDTKLHECERKVDIQNEITGLHNQCWSSQKIADIP